MDYPSGFAMTSIALPLSFDQREILAIVVGASFAAGLNVYATVATLGLLGHFSVIPLPPSLHILTSWWVIGPAVAMFVVEFFADKVPAFDLVWNALHTFVRVPIAALMGYAATSQLSPQAQLLSALLAATIAFAAHSGKFAARVAVTPSPEPASNIALSLGEDAIAIALTWVATTHPYLAAAFVAIALVMVIVLVRLVWKGMVKLFRGASRQIAKWQTEPRQPSPSS
jgi:hypothetical protein